MTHKIIAIDGPAASGKGTLAKKVAQVLGFSYMDTGALYRCVAKIVFEKRQNPEEEAAAVEAATYIRDHFDLNMLEDPVLRSDKMAQGSSQVAIYPKVREILLDCQRNFSQDQSLKGSVLDGRDIGTVVCPNADVKLYITASPEIRAERRYKELQSKGINVTYEAVLQEMLDRDARDGTRATAPMKPAEDAIILDTSSMSAEDVLAKALGIIQKHTA